MCGITAAMKRQLRLITVFIRLDAAAFAEKMKQGRKSIIFISDFLPTFHVQSFPNCSWKSYWL